MKILSLVVLYFFFYQCSLFQRNNCITPYFLFIIFKVIFYIPSITFSHTVEEYVFVPKMDISRAEDDFDL